MKLMARRPPLFLSSGFPTIKFKPAGTKEFIDYEGDRSFDNLVEFVKEHSNNPLETVAEEKEDSGVKLGEVETEAETGRHDEL
jgi:protein disulfide-isomerase A1